MIEHRAAVSERLVDQEADLSRRAVEGLRKLNLGRDQILTRLWELATLSHEATRGIIAGRIKALSMIVAIEGLVPSAMNDRPLFTARDATRRSAHRATNPHLWRSPTRTSGPRPGVCYLRSKKAKFHRIL
jgi:hypothetical protein